MAAIGTLRLAELGLKTVRTPLARNCLCLIPKTNTAIGCLRQMSSKRTIKVLPTSYEYRAWKDHMHLMIALGVVPLGIIIGLSNLFVGQAELAEIPEGYDPKHWEYYKHPISRFLARYWWMGQEKAYELELHTRSYHMKQAAMRRLERTVSNVMHEKRDYKGWYYLPANSQAVYTGAASRQQELEAMGQHS